MLPAVNFLIVATSLIDRTISEPDVSEVSGGGTPSPRRGLANSEHRYNCISQARKDHDRRKYPNAAARSALEVLSDATGPKGDTLEQKRMAVRSRPSSVHRIITAMLLVALSLSIAIHFHHWIL